MSTTVDLAPAANQMADLVRAVPDDALAAPTPCPAYSLGDLLDHVEGLSLAFAAAATKDTGGFTDDVPQPDASHLGDDWRTRIPEALDRLAHAWRDPRAWEGMTRAGGFDLPGEFAGLVALDELVVHGWDVARASGQPYDIDPTSLVVLRGFLSEFAGPEPSVEREGRFGPVVEVPEGAPLIDRVVGLTGRDPAWSPPGQE
jgi:uncharacterized protein (TIGR03086 family)